jgi:hypothetical protein
MKHISPAPCISVYENALNPDGLKAFIDALNEDIESGWSDLSWGNSGVGSEGVVSAYRTSLGCSLIPLLNPYPQTELSQLFDAAVKFPVEEIVKDYTREMMLPMGFFEPYSVLKYLPGSEYHAHYDHFRDNSRVFSMVTILGEPEEGGQLEFPTFGVTVEPKIGSVIMFPSNFPYLHVAHEVKAGIKYSLVAWYQ